MDVHVPKTWDDPLARRIDDGGVVEGRSISLADLGEAAVLNHNPPLLERRAAVPIDDRSALDDDHPVPLGHYLLLHEIAPAQSSPEIAIQRQARCRPRLTG